MRVLRKNQERFDSASLSVYNHASGAGVGIVIGKTTQMKRRHPMQIMEAAELVVGDVYAFVACHDGHTDLYEQHCIAVVTDTGRLLASRGRWRGQACSDDAYILGDLLDVQSVFSAAAVPQAIIVADDDIIPFTVHLDGWVPDGSKKSESMIVDWIDDEDFCNEHYSFDQGATREGHFIIVPVADWISDPRVHVLDWVNPDDIVKPPMRTVGALGSEAAASKRTNDNLQRIFG